MNFYFIETLNYECKVDPWRTVRRQLMKNIVAKEFYHISVACFTPVTPFFNLI